MPKTRQPHHPRNSEIVRGIMRFSKGAMYHKTGKWAKKFAGTPKKVVEKTVVTKPFGKDKKPRVIHPTGPSFYPTLDMHVVKKPTTTKKTEVAKVARVTRRTPKLRASIKPGQILIVLAGRFKGKRVVFLKQLTSGLLLITGPMKLNGVPFKRINQAYVIATATTIDISGVPKATLEKYTDAIFSFWFAEDSISKPKTEKKKKTEAEFFAATENKEKVKKVVSPERVAQQKAVDAPIVALVKKDVALYRYMRTKFTLTNGQYPHTMKF